ncbi:hypothetical protein J2X60_003310 [Curtobacterium sp. 320]|nr:hypothetical protein [Curtobacterium sp. 320]
MTATTGTDRAHGPTAGRRAGVAPRLQAPTSQPHDGSRTA